MTNNEASKYLTQHCNPDYPKGKTEWETAINMAIDALKSKLDEHEIWKISSVFQNYYCMGISEIAEEDEVCCSLFEKLGLL